MKADANAGIFFQMLEKRKIAIGVSSCEDMVKIPAGLVRMNKQRKMERLRHGDSFFSTNMITRPGGFVLIPKRGVA